MSRTPLNPDTLIGRTIKNVDHEAVNSWTLTLDNDEKINLEAEDAMSTPAGNIPGLFLFEAE